MENTADDYFVTSNGEDYDAIQAAYIVLRIMGYLRVPCLPSTIILPASVCLPICLFCLCDSMCERTTHARIQELLPGGGGGGGGSMPDCQKTVRTTFFLVLNLFYSFYRGCPMVISKKTIIFQGQNLPGGVSSFFQSGGPNANFYRNPYNV